MTRTTVLLATVLVTAAPTLAGDLPTVDSVLTHFITAVGGPDALNALEERHHQGAIIQDLTWTEPQHQETPFVATADTTGLVRYAETASWSDLPPNDATDLRTKLRWVFHPRFALVVEDFFPHLRVDRREVRDGRPTVVLVPRDLKPEHYSLYFDEETGLLTHLGYHNWLEDWREADGVLVPHRFVFGRKGGHTTYVWEEIAAGPPPEED
ncbi:MAG: hypothetical protein GY838_16745 [bacterium]|nr:hypothetical protein [bacterium]